MLLKEFSIKTGLSKETLRFYEKESLITPKRNGNNYREYSEEDYLQIEFLLKMKKTGMRLEEIKKYTELQKQGKHTEEERLFILKRHKKNLQKQQQELIDTIDFINQKITNHYSKGG